MFKQTPVLKVTDPLRSLLESHGLHHVAALRADVYNSEEGEGVLAKSWHAHVQAFLNWIRSGKHGKLFYLERNISVRSNPRLLMSDVSTVFIFLIPYGTGQRIRRRDHPHLPQSDCTADPLVTPARLSETLDGGAASLLPRIARYARFKDYHRVIRKKLTEAFAEVRASLPEPLNGSGSPIEHQNALNRKSRADFKYRVVIDSTPFLDRGHAHLAGLGFVGKNTMLIRPGLGSYFFIASVLTNLDHDQMQALGLQEDTAHKPIHDLNCGSCRRCVEACPTQAIKGDYTLDASRCFSYWSIESRETTPKKFLPAFGRLTFGCDICQDVCPYNFVTNHTERWSEFTQPDLRLQSPDLTLRFLSTLSQSDYERVFGGLPVTRAKREGLVRNALYSLLQLGDTKGLERAAEHWRHQTECPKLIANVLIQLNL